MVRAKLAFVAVCLAAGVSLVVQSTAVAAPSAIVVSARNVSGVSPWHGLNCLSPSGLPGTGWSSGLPQTTEPAIAVNPNNPLQQVAAWTDNDSGPDNTAFTTDGGRTWQESPPVDVDPCTGRPADGLAYEGSADPWVSWAPDGTVYFSSLPWSNLYNNDALYQEHTAVEATSASAGFKWSPAVYTANPLMADDKDTVLADNKYPNLVYTVSRNAGFGTPIGARGEGQLLFDRSTDGGKTWTNTVLADAGNTTSVYGTQPIVQLADGRLVETSGVTSTLGGGTRAFWSTDRGLSWSGPGAAQPATPHSASLGSFCGSPVSFPGGSGQYAVLNGRTILTIKTVEETASGPADFYLVRSDDGGQTWTQSLVYQSSYPIALPSIATDQNGRIAIVFDQVDTSDVTCSGSYWANGGGQKMTIPARTEFAVSGDQGQTWSKPVTIGAPWWNFASAPILTFFFGSVRLGDYQQITAVPRQGFATVTIEGDQLAADSHAPSITGLQSTVVGEVRVVDSQSAMRRRLHGRQHHSRSRHSRHARH